VWQVMREQHPRVFWRSRHNNAINIFYYAESDGCYKEPAWKVFWYGMRDLRDIEHCIARSRARPATLIDKTVAGASAADVVPTTSYADAMAVETAAAVRVPPDPGPVAGTG